MNLEEIIDYLVDNGIATKDEIELVTNINGYNEESINDIIYYRTAFHDIEQYLECEDEETYNEYYNDDEEDEEE